MWSVQTMKYCSDIKRNEALIHATTWKNFEGMMLNEGASHQRLHVVGFHPSEMPRICKSVEIESRVVVAKGWREVGMGRGDHLTGAEFPLGGDQNILKLDQVGCMTF